MDFSERLKRATDRGTSSRAEKALADAAEAISEEELKRTHAAHRRDLTDHIERRMKELADSLPGFQVETVFDERGRGTGLSRDDVVMTRGKRQNLFSRLQVIITPFNEFHVVAASAKGAIRNKEGFARDHYVALSDYSYEAFCEIIDRWILDYAEQYAAS